MITDAINNNNTYCVHILTLSQIQCLLWSTAKALWADRVSKRGRVKAGYQHRTETSTEITRSSLKRKWAEHARSNITSPIIAFWLHDITGIAKKWNCGKKFNAPRLCWSYGSQRTDMYRLGFPSKRTFLNSNKCSSYSLKPLHIENT